MVMGYPQGYANYLRFAVERDAVQDFYFLIIQYVEDWTSLQKKECRA